MCCPCCNKTKFIGCFDSCDLILQFGIATQSGVHTLKLNFGRSILLFESSVSVGEQITFDLSNINENYTYVGQVTQPDETIFVDVDGNDCFKFEIKKFRMP